MHCVSGGGGGGSCLKWVKSSDFSYQGRQSRPVLKPAVHCKLQISSLLWNEFCVFICVFVIVFFSVLIIVLEQEYFSHLALGLLSVKFED